MWKNVFLDRHENIAEFLFAHFSSCTLLKILINLNLVSDILNTTL